MLRVLLIILFIFSLSYCGDSGNGIKYYLRYDSVRKVFLEEISKNETRIVDFYEVQYKSGYIDLYKFIKDGKIQTIHNFKYDDSNHHVKTINANSNGKVFSVEDYNESGLIQRVRKFDKNKKLIEELFYDELQHKVRENQFVYDQQKLIKKKIAYNYQDEKKDKKITYYKFYRFRGRLLRVIDYIEIYNHDKLVGKEVHHYNDRATKTKVEFFNGKDLNKMQYYDLDGNLEEERKIDKKQKVEMKTYYDRKGNIIKKTKNEINKPKENKLGK